MFSRAAYCGFSKISSMEATGPQGTCACSHWSMTCCWLSDSVQSVTSWSTVARCASRWLMVPNTPSPATSGQPMAPASRAKILSLVQAIATQRLSEVG